LAHNTSQGAVSCWKIRPMATQATMTAVAIMTLFLLNHPLLVFATVRPPPEVSGFVSPLLLSVLVDPALGRCITRPFCGFIRFSCIHFQFSASTSGQSALNRAPPSPYPILPPPPLVRPPPVEFHHRLRAAICFRCATDADIDPVVISSLVMKDSNPVSIVETSHAGLKDLG
jgi:hypothetical protein